MRLADLGSAQFYANQACATFKDIVGTLTYMAPEIFKTNSGEKEEYDGLKADSFAAGIVIFQMFFGRPPFNIAVAEKD